jgi:hypothetical protein
MSAEKMPEDNTPRDDNPPADPPVDPTDVGGADPDPVEPDEEDETVEDSDEPTDDPTDNVRQLLPVHAAPNTGKNPLVVKRGRGRPRKVERMPTTSDLEYHAAMSAEKQKFIDADPIVLAAKGKDAITLIRALLVEVAKESAALHFQRIENEKYGRDTAQISSRRVETLNKIASIQFELKKLGADAVDLHGERFQRVFSFWILSLKEVAQDLLTPEQCDLFFNRLETVLDGWEDRASEEMAGK